MCHTEGNYPHIRRKYKGSKYYHLGHFTRSSVGPGLTGRQLTFLLDNNAMDALVSNAAGPTVIQAMAQPMWYRIAGLSAEVWSIGYRPQQKIAGAQSRNKTMPFPSRLLETPKRLRAATSAISSDSAVARYNKTLSVVSQFRGNSMADREGRNANASADVGFWSCLRTVNGEDIFVSLGQNLGASTPWSFLNGI